MKHCKKIAALFALACILFVLGGCAEKKTVVPTDSQHPVATITMEDGRTMVAELYPEYAPNTVANFIELANSGFYDGIRFHRVVKDFVIQAGQAMTAGREEIDYCIKGEFAENGFKQNTLKHEKGVLSMARTAQSMDSQSSQFFIMTGDAAYLDGQYAAFGKLMDDASLKNALKIGSVATNSNDVPINAQTITSIRVETFGVDYGSPEKIGRN